MLLSAVGGAVDLRERPLPGVHPEQGAQRAAQVRPTRRHHRARALLGGAVPPLVGHQGESNIHCTNFSVSPDREEELRKSDRRLV